MSETDEKRTWPISPRLKLARAASQPRLSQLALAQKVQALGLAYFQNGKASRLESGYAYATWVEVEAIARALNVDPHWLANIEKPVAVPKATSIDEESIEAPKLPVLPKTAPAPKLAPSPKPSPVAPAPILEAVPAPTQHAPEPAPGPPPAPEIPPLPIPPQGSLTISDYRSLLGVERRKAEEAMGQKGLPAAEWRRWREYSRSLNEVLRTLY